MSDSVYILISVLCSTVIMIEKINMAYEAWIIENRHGSISKLVSHFYILMLTFKRVSMHLLKRLLEVLIIILLYYCINCVNITSVAAAIWFTYIAGTTLFFMSIKYSMDIREGFCYYNIILLCYIFLGIYYFMKYYSVSSVYYNILICGVLHHSIYYS